MEVLGVGNLQTIQKVHFKESVKAVHSQPDTLAISSEAQKKAEWVEMLKNMPEIRSEKLAQLSSDPHNSQILSAVAQKIISEVAFS